MFYEFCYLNVNGNLAFSIDEDNETYIQAYSKNVLLRGKMKKSFIKIYKTISNFFDIQWVF